MVLIALSVIALLCAAVAGAALLRVRPSPTTLGQAAGQLDTPDGWRERAAATLPLRPTRHARLADGGEAGWVTRPDLQPAQAPGGLAPQMRSDNWPVGLAVTALAADPIGCEQQDIYYVQRNVVALARGLSETGAAQRAAALTLSAVMASSLGRTQDGDAALRRSFRSANRLVRSVSLHEPKHSDMAATLDVMVMAVDGDRPYLHFAHVGNSSIWLQRAGSTSVELLTESHAIDGGPLLRAVGVSHDLVPEIGHVQVDLGDRIFLTTASRYFTFTPMIMNAIAHAGSPLHEVVAALTDAALADTALADAALADAALADAALADAALADTALTDAALADIVRSSAAPEGVTIVAAEVARPTSFQALSAPRS